MEFTGKTTRASSASSRVEIETEWNLKVAPQCRRNSEHLVEIETEWNLKMIISTEKSIDELVEIETEWNLKLIDAYNTLMSDRSRDRNRVEFKGMSRDMRAGQR